MEELSDFAVKEWHRIGCSSIRKRGQFFAALSGGETPRMIYRDICQKDTLNDYGKVVLFQVDERYVNRDSELSNFKMIVESFNDCSWMNKELLVSIPVESGSARKDAELYESKIMNTNGLCQKKIPVFDLIFLGIGVDGHTASLFPGNINVHEKRNVCETLSPDGVERITLSMKVIRKARNLILIAAGKDKAEAVRNLVYNLDVNTPINKVLENRSNIRLLFDSEASSLLLK